MADSRFFDREGPFSVGDLAQALGADLLNCPDPDVQLHDVAPLDKAEEGYLSFFDNIKYIEALRKTGATACIVAPGFTDQAPKSVILIVSKEPYKSYARAASLFYPEARSQGEIHPSAVIHDTATLAQNVSIGANAVVERGVSIGANSMIGPNCTIGTNVVIGEDCMIAANVSITHSLIKNHVTLLAGARLGEDGFGFAPDPAGHLKIPQLGRVLIGNSVVIGANSTIDRGSGPDTIIGDGTWIDNMVQVAHNVCIGRGCIIASQAGISGSTRLEDFVVLGGQSGLAGHLTVGMGTQIGAQSGVISDVPAGQVYAGFPAMPKREFFRLFAILRKLASKGKKRHD